MHHYPPPPLPSSLSLSRFLFYSLSLTLRIKESDFVEKGESVLFLPLLPLFPPCLIPTQCIPPHHLPSSSPPHFTSHQFLHSSPFLLQRFLPPLPSLSHFRSTLLPLSSPLTLVCSHVGHYCLPFLPHVFVLSYALLKWNTLFPEKYSHFSQTDIFFPFFMMMLEKHITQVRSI